ncbi:hypothetical protein DIPPA_12122 [Diplonema papillatum]|nr:hypothetical protein DIPPA_12122 [Diplonema papillatum]
MPVTNTFRRAEPTYARGVRPEGDSPAPEIEVVACIDYYADRFGVAFLTCCEKVLVHFLDESSVTYDLASETLMHVAPDYRRRVWPMRELAEVLVSDSVSASIQFANFCVSLFTKKSPEHRVRWVGRKLSHAAVADTSHLVSVPAQPTPQESRPLNAQASGRGGNAAAVPNDRQEAPREKHSPLSTRQPPPRVGGDSARVDPLHTYPETRSLVSPVDIPRGGGLPVVSRVVCIIAAPPLRDANHALPFIWKLEAGAGEAGYKCWCSTASIPFSGASLWERGSQESSLASSCNLEQVLKTVQNRTAPPPDSTAPGTPAGSPEGASPCNDPFGPPLPPLGHRPEVKPSGGNTDEASSLGDGQIRTPVPVAGVDHNPPAGRLAASPASRKRSREQRAATARALPFRSKPADSDNRGSGPALREADGYSTPPNSSPKPRRRRRPQQALQAAPEAEPQTAPRRRESARGRRPQQAFQATPVVEPQTARESARGRRPQQGFQATPQTEPQTASRKKSARGRRPQQAFQATPVAEPHAAASSRESARGMRPQQAFQTTLQTEPQTAASGKKSARGRRPHQAFPATPEAEPQAAAPSSPAKRARKPVVVTPDAAEYLFDTTSAASTPRVESGMPASEPGPNGADLRAPAKVPTPTAVKKVSWGSIGTNLPAESTKPAKNAAVCKGGTSTPPPPTPTALKTVSWGNMSAEDGEGGTSTPPPTPNAIKKVLWGSIDATLRAGSKDAGPSTPRRAKRAVGRRGEAAEEPQLPSTVARSAVSEPARKRRRFRSLSPAETAAAIAGEIEADFGVVPEPSSDAVALLSLVNF